MNKSNNGSHYGFTQYCYPKDFELSGKTFVLKSDDNVYTLEFRDNSFINFKCGDCEVLSQYEALKIDDSTHIAFFGEFISIAVLDFENGLASISVDGDGKYNFCRIDGFESTDKLHCYTNEMSGTHVKWYFGFERFLDNIYNGDSSCRCIWSPRTDRPRTIPAVYIKVKDGVYLCELNSTSPFRTDIPQGFSKIVMLQNYDRLLTVGCIYSPALNEFRLISGYAMSPDEQ